MHISIQIILNFFTNNAMEILRENHVKLPLELTLMLLVCAYQDDIFIENRYLCTHLDFHIVR